MRGLAFKAPRLTKRQRKAQRRTPTAAIENSLERGNLIKMSDRQYIGANPQFAPVNMPGMPTEYRKVSAGVPFVLA
ncbi:hypothetical protein [Oceanospirillum phage vB_OsaM_PD0307]|nr:hypothetical protein [Oceanospirillum phage vB_OsaM_PD0307]